MKSPSSSPFCVGNVISDPKDFWGREWEIRFTMDRVKKRESTSIIGSRRLGKTSLAKQIYFQSQQELTTTHEVVWLDGQSTTTKTLDLFFKSIYQACSIPLPDEGLPDSSNDLLLTFEENVRSLERCLTLIVNEFEIIASPDNAAQFTKQFYNTLRLLAEDSQISLVTTSMYPIKNLCAHTLGVSSPFYNIFETVPLDVFKAVEADGFLDRTHRGVTLAGNEKDLVRSKVTNFRHPLVIQIACETVFLSRHENWSESSVLSTIEVRTSQFLGHDDVSIGRSEVERQGHSFENGITKRTDLIVSTMLPVGAVAFLMAEYGLLIRSMEIWHSLLLGLVTAILGFGVLLFAGRISNVIGESTFYKLLIHLVDQLPIISNLMDKANKSMTKQAERD